MQPWIQNVSYHDIQKGHHFDPGPKAMLIQIVDHGLEFPEPKYHFTDRHQFLFMDMEEHDRLLGQEVPELKIQDEQAVQLVSLLKYALEKEMNVVVHCVVGVCRSGAVVEVGVMMGFTDPESFRAPNLMVKHKMMKALGWTYDSKERVDGEP